MSDLKQNTYLNSQMETYERGKSYLCRICKSTIIHNSRLQVHMLKHSGDKPNSFQVCGSIFSENYFENTYMYIYQEDAISL